MAAVVVAAQRKREACGEDREDHGQSDAHGDVGAGLVQNNVPGVLQEEEHLAGDREAAGVEKKTLQDLSWCGGVIRGAPPLPARFIAARMRKRTSDGDGADAEDEQRMGRADDLDVEAVGGVPPVVEGGGGEHRDAAPARDEDAERSAEAEDVDGRRFELFGVAEGGGKDEVDAR